MAPELDAALLTYLPQGLLRELWVVYRSDPTLQACRAIIQSRLFSGGFTYADNSGKALVDGKFFAHTQQHFVPFARDVADAICVQGFAAFVLDTRNNIPVVVPPGQGRYAVHVHPRSYRRTMVFEDAATATQNARVLFVVENWPVDGWPISPVSAFRRSYGFKAMVEMNTATADYYAARPLVYTSTDSSSAFNPQWVYNQHYSLPVDVAPGQQQGGAAGGSGLVRAGLAANPYADPRSQVQRRADAAIDYTRRVAKASSAAGEYHARLASDLNSGRLDLHDVRLDPFTGLPVFDVSSARRKEEAARNVVQLPIDSRVLATVTPHSRGDLVPIMEHTARQACVAMGVPPSALGSGGHTALEAAASEDMLRSTLQRYRKSVTLCLCKAYQGLYGEKENLTVFFPGLMSTNMARTLFGEQILTYDAFRGHIMSIYSVPRDHFRTEEERALAQQDAQQHKKRRIRDGDALEDTVLQEKKQILQVRGFFFS